jgi:hypothetical protein
MSDEEKWLIENKVAIRLDNAGNFDELLLYDGQECIVHAEMMDRDTLWIGIYPRGEKERRVMMWIRAPRGKKLSVEADEN